MSRRALGHHVYIVECCDGTLYTGYTRDLEQRLKAHNQGKGAKYTRARRPVRLVYWESCESRSAALKRERQIKAQSREVKLQLIQGQGLEVAVP